METEPKPRIHKKRRERAHRVLVEQTDTEGEQEGDEISPSRGGKERSRSKPRKKKNNVGTYEEDIIDGFAIVSFKSIEDLEKYTCGKLTKCNGTDKNKRNTSISPARHKAKPNVKKKGRFTQNNIPKNKRHNNSAADNSESSGETTDNLDTNDLILNGPKKSNTRRFSDVSTRSSSGAGYLCDSESGDERVSDASLDIFTTKPLNPAIRVSEEQEIKASFPAVSSLTTTITTACPVTSTTSDVTVTTVTTTTSCVSLTSALTTTSVTVTTATPVVVTTSSSNHINNHHHHPYHPHRNHHNHQHIGHHSVIEKYSPHINHAQKPHHERESRPTGSPVIKRRPPTPPLNKPLSRSPPRHKIPPPLSSIAASSSSSPLAPSLSSSTSNSVISKEPKRSSPLTKPPVRREESRERDSYQVLPPNLATTKSFFPPGYPSHGAATPGLYSSLGPSPGLHPLHSSPSQQAAFPGAPGLASLHPHHPQAPPTPHTPHMFAPPLPLGPPAGPLAGSAPAPPAHLQPESPLSSLTSPDLLRDELNRRFLASQERTSLLQNMPPFMRADIHQHMHQHQHQHQHQHMHQHMYHPGLPPPASSASLVPTPTANLYEKVPSTPLFRPGLPHRPGIAEPAPRIIPTSKDKPPTIPRASSSIPGLPGYPSLLLNPSAPDALNSGIPGAFQPKGLTGLHPAVGPMFLPGRELEKAAAQPTIPAAQSSLPTTAKKPGKWCAVHVRIAWEIHHHQQKQGDKGSETKPMDPLRPPSHLMPGSSLLRPQEMPSSGSSSLLSSGRGLYEGNSHNLLNSAAHIGPPFPRPSPYSIGTSLPVGIGNGLSSTSREPPPSVPSGSHEWNRLHRTPPTFPVTPSWAKVEERDKEIEREREREMSMERRREEERERERRLIDQERHRFSTMDDRSRERDRFRENELLSKSRSRSRSRSPMRNGRLESIKHERPFQRRLEETSNNMMKVKEERRESLTREDDIMSERDRLLKSEYLNPGALRGADPFMQASLVERARMLTPAAYLGGDRVPPHHSLWNPFDKGPGDFANHRLSLQREMEQTREHLLNRFPVPGMQSAFPGFLEQERLREEMIMRDTERAKRDYLERLPVIERDRLYYENKIPGLRPPDQLSMGHLYSRNISPALNHIKRSSPCVIPGAPPPLIHSGSSSQTRGHNSPAVNKTKGVSPTDSVGESKRDSNSNSTDPDAHSR